MKPTFFFLAGALALSVGAARAQDSNRRFPRIGPEIGYAYFLDSKTRATFGSSVTDFGVGFGNIAPSLDGRVGLDFSIVRPSEDRNGVNSDALVITVGPEYRRVYIPGAVRRQVIIQQGQQDNTQQYPPGTLPPGTQPPSNPYAPPPVLPYYGASANLIYAQVDAPLNNADGNGFGVGASVFAGVTFNNRFYVEGRLRGTTNVEGYNFSRAGVTFGLRF